MKTYPKKVKIIEVGPRDGLQNESKIISTQDKVKFIQKLTASGIKNIEIGSFVSPKHVPQLSDAEEVVKNLKQNADVIYSALVPNLKGLDRAMACGVKRVAVFTSASETFTEKNINMTIPESLRTYKEVIQKVQKNNMSARGYISTCFVCPYEGEIKKDKVLEVAISLLEMGVDEISIGDTIGAASPKDIFETVGFLLGKIPGDKMALHFHDTYGTALANVVAGLELGITAFDSSAGGLGGCPYAPGASGNVATEDLIYILTRMGIKTNIDLKKLAEASLFMQNVLGKDLPSKQLKKLISRASRIST